METSPLEAVRWLDEEPKPVLAGVLTFAVHGAIVLLLMFNLSWHQKIAPQATVKLWESMPGPSNKSTARNNTRKKTADQPTRKAKSAPPPPQALTPAPAPPSATQRMLQQPVAVAPAPAPAAAPRAAPATAAMPAIAAPAPAPPMPMRGQLAAPVREPAGQPVLEPLDSARPAPPDPPSPTPELPPALAAPTRNTVTPPTPAAVNPEPTPVVSVEPPSTPLAPPVQQQTAPQPEVDIDNMKRQRALAIAQQLREEEATRLDESLAQERAAMDEEYKKRAEAREQKLAQELDEIRDSVEQRREEQESQAAAEAAARQMTEDYRTRISAKVRQRVILPPDLRGNPEAIYEVSLLPSGDVIQVRLLQTSGVDTYDAAVERAILAAQPLPVPEEPGLFQANFKNLLLNFRPIQ